MAWNNRWTDYEEGLEYEEGRDDYSNKQLNQLADDFLRSDAKMELCRDCDARGVETGEVKSAQQEATDGEGHMLVIDFPEYKCENGHNWFKGEGKARGIGGDDPILFEEHLQQRRRREIYNTTGVPDPSIKAGIYNRTHPQGRKVNSPEQRKRNGASYYR